MSQQSPRTGTIPLRTRCAGASREATGHRRKQRDDNATHSRYRSRFLKRRRALTTLVKEHIKAELVVVPSVQAAIRVIGERAPDLILAPALLSPPDEAELLTHMKQLDTAPYIQMLTLPALDMLVDAPAEQTGRRGLFGPVFNRRPVSLGLKYDRGMVAAQIADGLSRARELRIEYAAMLAYHEAAEYATRQVTLARPGGAEVLEAASAFLAQQKSKSDADERRVALRKGRGDVPWLSGIKVSWGPELQLVNISSTGVLVESGSKFAPGSTTDLHLSRPRDQPRRAGSLHSQRRRAD